MQRTPFFRKSAACYYNFFGLSLNYILTHASAEILARGYRTAPGALEPHFAVLHQPLRMRFAFPWFVPGAGPHNVCGPAQRGMLVRRMFTGDDAV